MRLDSLLVLVGVCLIGAANAQGPVIVQSTYNKVNGTDIKASVASLKTKAVSASSISCMALCTSDPSCVLAVLKASRTCNTYGSMANSNIAYVVDSVIFQKSNR